MTIPLMYRDDVAETLIVKRTQRIYRHGAEVEK